MITIDNVDTSGFNAGVGGFIHRLGIEAPKVVHHEAGALITTLVRVTPPKDVAKSKKVAGERTAHKFVAASNQEKTYFRHASDGITGITWYSWSPEFLYGVAKSKDMTDASVEELYKVAVTLTKGGRQNLAFMHPRKRQRVLISQSILTTPEQRAAVVKKIQDHFGRLKAGWIVAWGAGVVKIAGNLPKYVTKHLAGARGRYIDGLADRENPTFTIGNSAKGITAPKVASFVQFALNLRAKAMATNLALFLKGRKFIGDYANG